MPEAYLSIVVAMGLVTYIPRWLPLFFLQVFVPCEIVGSGYVLFEIAAANAGRRRFALGRGAASVRGVREEHARCRGN